MFAGMDRHQKGLSLAILINGLLCFSNFMEWHLTGNQANLAVGSFNAFVILLLIGLLGWTW